MSSGNPVIRHRSVRALGPFGSDSFDPTHLHVSASYSGWQLGKQGSPRCHTHTECCSQTIQCACLLLKTN